MVDLPKVEGAVREAMAREDQVPGQDHHREAMTTITKTLLVLDQEIMRVLCTTMTLKQPVPAVLAVKVGQAVGHGSETVLVEVEGQVDLDLEEDQEVPEGQGEGSGVAPGREDLPSMEQTDPLTLEKQVRAAPDRQEAEDLAQARVVLVRQGVEGLVLVLVRDLAQALDLVNQDLENQGQDRVLVVLDLPGEEDKADTLVQDSEDKAHRDHLDHLDLLDLLDHPAPEATEVPQDQEATEARE